MNSSTIVNSTIPTGATNYNRGGDDYFGPDDQLTPTEVEQCRSDAMEQLLSNDAFNAKLNLEEDNQMFKVSGQNVALVSFIGPYDLLKVKHKDLQFCIRGAFNNQKKSVDKIINITNTPGGKKYDIFTIGMYEWVAIPPNVQFMQSVEKHEDYLNQLVIKHRTDMELSAQLFEKRKNKINQTLPTNLQTQSTTILQIPDKENTEPETKENTPPSIVNPHTNLQNPNKPLTNLENSSNVQDFDYNEKLDQCKVEGQNWAIISILGDIQHGMALKIQGLYTHEKDAREILDRMKGIDDTFTSFIVETYRWLPTIPDIDQIKDHVYQNEKLNEINKAHTEEQDRAQDYNMKKHNQGEISQYPTYKHTPTPTTPNVTFEILTDDVQPTDILAEVEKNVN